MIPRQGKSKVFAGDVRTGRRFCAASAPLVALCLLASASYGSEPAPTDSSGQASQAPTSTPLQQALETLRSNVTLLLVAGASALAIAIRESINNRIKKQLQKNAADAITEPIQHSPGDRNLRASAMLLGIGGVGKTTFIRKILNNENANPQQRTEGYKLYYGTRSKQGADNNKTYHFHVSDYKGQNVGTLVQAFVLQQKVAFSPMAYGHVNAVIIMVDLFAPTRQAVQKAQTEPDAARVKEHLDAWRPLALDAVFGLLTRDLRYLCLFINKSDLLLRNDDDWEARVKEKFEPLRKLLELRITGLEHIEFEVVVGSANRGDGLLGVIEDLERASVPGTTVAETTRER